MGGKQEKSNNGGDDSGRRAIPRAVQVARSLADGIGMLHVNASHTGETEITPRDRDFEIRHLEILFGRICRYADELQKLIATEVDGKTIDHRLADLHGIPGVSIGTISATCFTECAQRIGKNLIRAIAHAMFSHEDFLSFVMNPEKPITLDAVAAVDHWKDVRAAIFSDGLATADFDRLETCLLGEHRAVEALCEKMKENRSEEETEEIPRHSDDFRSVNWFGVVYEFTANQAACVKVLWENWERDCPTVGDQTILEAADCDSQRLPLVFRNHDAWQTMIVEGKSKGTHRLAQPEINSVE